MKRVMWYSAALLLLVAVTAQAQDKKPPFEWKTSGDTIETFKAEFVLNTPTDQATAEATVNSYMLLTDGRTEHAKLTQAVYYKGMDVVNKSLAPLYEKLLSAELAKAQAAATEENSKERETSSYNSEAATVTATSDGEKGAKLVETVQKYSYEVDAWDPETGEPTGKKETHSGEVKSRFTLVKGEDGKWCIDRIEQMQKNWEKMDEMGNAPEEWAEVGNALSWYLGREEAEKAEELKQDTPENTALSLFNSVMRNRDNWTTQVYSSGQESMAKSIKPLFTAKGLKGPAEDGEKLDMSRPKREVDKVSDGTEGVKKVKLKSTSEWSGAIEVHVKKDGESWKIVAAGYYDVSWNEMGDMVEGAFVEVKNVDEIAWR